MFGVLRVRCRSGGVGGSGWWFGTSVEDTAELPRSQGSLPVNPEAENLHVFLSQTKHTSLEFYPLFLTSQLILLCPTTGGGQHRVHGSGEGEEGGERLSLQFPVRLCFRCSQIEN